MKIKVELNAEKYAIGKCPFYEEVVAGGRVCRMLCKYSSNFNIKERTFECAAPSLKQVKTANAEDDEFSHVGIGNYFIEAD